MAPSLLLKRDHVACDLYGNCYNVSDRWNDYGRWVAASGLIVFFFLLFLLCACMSARRRRKMGSQPFYGTTWMAPKPPHYSTNAQHQNPSPGHGEYGGYYGAPAPPYSPNPAFTNQTTGTTENNNGSQYYPPPPGPPPPQSYEMHNVATPPPTHPPVHVQQTGSSMQSNNPYCQPPEGPPEAHFTCAVKQ